MSASVIQRNGDEFFFHSTNEYILRFVSAVYSPCGRERREELVLRITRCLEPGE